MSGQDRMVRRLQFRLFADIEAAPRKLWLASKFLGAGEMSCAYGPPGGAKSLFAGDLSIHVAAGLEWFERRVLAGAVLYVACERGALVKRRMAAWRIRHGINDLPLGVVSDSINLKDSPADAHAVVAAGRELCDRTQQDLRLVVIDTASRALAGGDENSPKDMGAFVNSVALIQKETGAHVLVIHHIPVDGSQRMRGHGALLAACDTTVRIERSGDIRTATIDKTNDGDEGEQVAFKIEGVELGGDPETDEATTAPVLVACDSPPPSNKRHARLPAAAKTALDSLKEALGECGKIAPASNHIPPAARTVTVEQWRQYAYRRGISATDTTDRARQMAFKRASEALIGSKAISTWDGIVWLS